MEINHLPRKRFGQNFLQNKQIIQQILSVLHVQKKDKIVEIGPGLGALTIPLLPYVDHLIAIEIDTDLQLYLKALPVGKDKLEIIPADALTVDYGQWGSEVRIIGNLPYNISTPLIIHLLQYSSDIQDMYFMLQKEVVDRLAAKPGTKAFGRLTVMVQYFCEVESLFLVPPEAFYPKPKVDSAVVRLTPYASSPYPATDLNSLEKLVAQAFSMRRKTLANNLKSLLSATEIENLKIDPKQRPEQLSVGEFVRLNNYLNKQLA